MHVLVLGAGVVGVTTAYYLSKLGYRITVVDSSEQVADGASHANAGQLSYSYTDSLARPTFFATLPGLMLGRDLASTVRLDPALMTWGLRFLRQCTTRKADANTDALLQIALRSAEFMDDILSDVPIEFAHRHAGKLVLLSGDRALEHAERTTRIKNRRGCDVRIISREETLEIEPAIREMNSDFDAAVYSRDDDIGDSRLFVDGMRQYLENNAEVEFRLGAEVDRLIVDKAAVVGAAAGAEELTADAVVVCLGAWSAKLLRQVGVHVPIYPVRGYSLTLPAGDRAPSVSVTSLKHKIVLGRINGSIRIAGFADFGGFDTSGDEPRTRQLLDLARSVAPGAADYGQADAQRWGGFRAMTPNGLPLSGATHIPKLYTNTGHGMLGWTLACATASTTAESIARTH